MKGKQQQNAYDSQWKFNYNIIHVMHICVRDNIIGIQEEYAMNAFPRINMTATGVNIKKSEYPVA